MTSKNAGRLAAALTLLVASTACERGVTDLEPADFPNAASVFEDGFGPGVDFAAFEFSRVDALDIDNDEVFRGTSSMRFDVPDAEDPSGGFVGGVFYSSPRNLSGYNALTFWAKASRTVDVEEIGFGLDDAGNSRFQTALTNLQLTSSWQQFAIPIPGPGSLTQEGGLFYLSEANQAGAPYSIWFDEVAFADLESVGAPQAEMLTRTVGMAVGDEVQADVDLAIPVGGVILDVQSSLAYYDWTSSDPAVATVSESGLIEKVGEGTAEVTATLSSAPVSGSVTVEDGAGLAGVVFDDAFGAGIGFASFGDGAKTDAVSPDDTEAYQGSRSLRITVPGEGDPTGLFAGGVFRVEDETQLRDLSGFNALTFWAKAATPASFDVVGFGNDNTGASQFSVLTSGLPLTAEWQRFVIPIPDPAKLSAEGGLFTFAEGAENGAANTIWVDEIIYMDLDEVGTAEAALVAETFTLAVGDTARVQYSLSFPVDGESVSVLADARYFTWTSADPAVATVSESGLITMVAEGATTITATLGDVPATGAVTVQTGGAAIPPTAPAPDPTQPAADVISIYSDSYDDVPNEGFNRYGFADFAEVDVAGSGNSALRYTLVDRPEGGGNFQVIELGGANIIDAAAAGMTHFRFDAWVPGDVAGSEFVVGVVNIDPDNPPATRGDVRASATSTPPIAQGQWLSFDVPLSSLTGLAGTGHIQQVVVDLVNTDEVYLDNLYFYGGDGDNTGPPTAPAPNPTQPAADVISIYSDSYDDVGNEGFNRYGAAGFEIVDVAGSGNSALRYTLLDVQDGNFQIMELGGANAIDAAGAGMTHFRFDVYVPVVETGSEFVVGLVNIDPANPPATRGDVRPSATSTPPIAQGQWLSFDVPLSELTGLAGTNAIQQVAVDLVNTGEIYLDNLYFHGAEVGGPPSAPAPEPTQPAGDVISIYSDSYDDVGNEGFNRYGAAGFEIVDVAGSGNSALRYTLLDVQDGNFQIMELGGANAIDAALAGMTHFRFDVYVPVVETGSEFVVGLVNIDPANPPATRGDVRPSATSTPPIAQGQWLSFDVPLSELTGLAGTNAIQQVAVDLVNTGEIYLDNLYFYIDDEPTVGTQISLPITFDDPAVNYVLDAFEGGGPASLVADPTDGGNTVAQLVKSATAGAFAGVTMTGATGLASPIPFTASSTSMTVRVYSPDAGIEVRLKVETNGDPTRSVETGATTTVANAWETLTFDFSNQTSGTAALNLDYVYDKVSIFFNIGIDGATAGEKIYLWDDVLFQN